MSFKRQDVQHWAKLCLLSGRLQSFFIEISVIFYEKFWQSFLKEENLAPQWNFFSFTKMSIEWKSRKISFQNFLQQFRVELLVDLATYNLKYVDASLWNAVKHILDLYQISTKLEFVFRKFFSILYCTSSLHFVVKIFYFSQQQLKYNACLSLFFPVIDKEAIV